MTPNKPKIPGGDDMGRLRHGGRFRGEAEAEFKLVVETITPRIGGGAAPRTVGEDMRPASLRGIWRTWWRALQPLGLAGQDMAAAEVGLWGGMGRGGDKPVRSRVDVQAVRRTQSEGPGRNWFADFQYALWPFQEQKTSGEAAVQPKSPGERFELCVRCPKGKADAVQRTLIAWLLFGGYGGRTRRGVGSLAPIEFSRDGTALNVFVPAEPNATGRVLSDLLGCTFGEACATDETPRLSGATLLMGTSTTSAVDAWRTAINLLRDFRQGVGIARTQGNRRPGRSVWPEPDRIRRQSGNGPWAHLPRFGRDGGWPRAAFGLPIQTRFQNKDGNQAYYQNPEPRAQRLELADNDRLASPVIVKAMALAGGAFAPIVLWLNRTYPKQKLKLKNGTQPIPLNVGCDEILGPNDVAPADDAGLFERMQTATAKPEGLRVRSLFCDWVQTKGFRRI